MEQSLAGKGDGEELIDIKVGGVRWCKVGDVHLTDKDLQPVAYDMGNSLLIIL